MENKIETVYLKEKELNQDYSLKKKAFNEETKLYKAKLKEIRKAEKEEKRRMRELPKKEKRELQAMQRKALGLPSYTHGEELMNAISHIVGGAFGIVALITGVYYAVINQMNAGAITAMAFFGFSIIFLYTMSAIYHFLNVNKAKKVFQYIDHSTIFVLISGTYVPVCTIMLSSIYPYNFLVLGIVVCLSIVGISLVSTMMDKMPVKIVSHTLYLVIGWLIIFFYSPLVNQNGLAAVIMFIAGGVSYSLGAIIYAIGKYKKYFHFIFHIFCLAGTILQFLGVLLYGVIGI